MRRLHDTTAARHQQDRESGQAMVEFVLVLFPYSSSSEASSSSASGSAIGTNLNRIANEGARWAANNDWPECAWSAPAVCNNDATCDDSLEDFLRCQATNAGIPASAVVIEVCQPAGASPEVGEPVTVRLASRVNFLSASAANPDSVGVGDSGFAEWLGITIRGEATMRLETTPAALSLGACDVMRQKHAQSNGESGQAVVEFALVLFPLLLLVVGIVQFGIAVSFWQDQQRLAAAGARVAIVNCSAASWCTPTLEQYLEAQPLSRGNRPDAQVCFLTKSNADEDLAVKGDSIRVRLSMPFTLVPIFRVGTIQIGAETTMRLEQDATHLGIASEETCPQP